MIMHDEFPTGVPAGTAVAAASVDPLGPPLAMAKVQGDILVGLQKNAEVLQLFTITDRAAFRYFVAKLPVTMAEEAHAREVEIERRRQAGDNRRVPTDSLNVAFTHQGWSCWACAGFVFVGDAL
jgi:hypothetical protein